MFTLFPGAEISAESTAKITADVAELVRACPWFVEPLYQGGGPGPDSDIPHDVFAAELEKTHPATVNTDDGHRPAPRKSQRPMREAARRVLVQLFPKGIPDQPSLPNKILVARVASHLKFEISPDTILRAAGRKK